MYHEYAADARFRINVGIRRRLAPLLYGERRRIELMNALLLSLKGSPVLYYGDEIGMGDDPFLGDRNGVRTPMHWSPDKNGGFSRAEHHQLFLPMISRGPYSYEFVNVEDAERNSHSLLSFMKRLLALRKQHARVFGRGSMTMIPLENQAVLGFVRGCDRHGSSACTCDHEDSVSCHHRRRIPPPTRLPWVSLDGVGAGRGHSEAKRS